MKLSRWRQEGQEPDYRFSLANERTFLAWIRTALALLAGGVLLQQFAHSAPARPLLTALGLALSVLSAVLCGMAFHRWKGNEVAMRHARPLPATVAIPLLSAALLVLAALVIVYAWW
jgi:putative membrane protein